MHAAVMHAAVMHVAGVHHAVAVAPCAAGDGRDAGAAFAVHPQALFHRLLAVAHAAVGVVLARLRLGRQHAACGDETENQIS